MAKLAKIGILFSAKLTAILAAFAGLVCGIFYAFGGAIYDLMTIGFNAGTVLAFGALIGMPLVFAACGAVGGAVGAVCYNLLASRTGGIELDVQQG